MKFPRSFVACALSLSLGIATVKAETISDLTAAMDAATDSGKPIFVYAFDSV